MEDLKAAGARECIRFVENEIDLSTTFLDLARTEASMNEPAAVKSLLAKARLGFETAARFLSAIESPEERDRLRTKLDRLAERISATRTELNE